MEKENYLKERVDWKYTFHLEDLINMKPNIGYEYVPSDFAILIARRMKIYKAYYRQRYIENDEEWNKSYQHILDLKGTRDWDIHTDLWKHCQDDVLLIGESDKQWIYVYLDHDVSDCTVCFVAKKGYKEYVDYKFEDEDDCYCYVEPTSYETIDEFLNDIFEIFSETDYNKFAEIQIPQGWFKW